MAAFVCAALAAGSAAGDGAPAEPPELRVAADWATPAGNLAGTRAAASSAIQAGNVARLRPRWRFRFPGEPGFSGNFASVPLAVGSRVFVQDLKSSVYALDRQSGRLLWARRAQRPSGGPNGLAAAWGKIFASSPTGTFALDARTGKLLWQARLTSRRNPVTIAPVAARGLVYTSTTGMAAGGRGTIYALDAADGRVRWRFDTIRDPWRFPGEAGGGGAWFPPSLDGRGRVYFGTANPYPWGGSRRRPNGGMYPGPVLYTDSLVVLDAAHGQLVWTDQVTPHDVRDLDFQATPILARVRRGGRSLDVVIGAGKSGRVVAWDRLTHRRLWQTAVGLHVNDRGPLPREPVRVCPGLLGGVETPMALAPGRLLVPVVDLCFVESAFGTSVSVFHRADYSKGRGELVALDPATGSKVWVRRFASPVFGCATVANAVVFTATYDGRVLALSTRDGRTLWTARARAGINGCPAVAADLLLVGAGAPHPELARPVPELVAYGP